MKCEKAEKKYTPEMSSERDERIKKFHQNSSQKTMNENIERMKKADLKDPSYDVF